MPTDPRAHPPFQTAAVCLDLLLDLTRDEHVARAHEETLRADRCYSLRQSLLDTLAVYGLDAVSERHMTGIDAIDDPCAAAETLIATLRAT